jgi:hypothetical protein
LEEVRQEQREIRGHVSYVNLATLAFTYRLLFERYLPAMIHRKSELVQMINDIGINTNRNYDEWQSKQS